MKRFRKSLIAISVLLFVAACSVFVPRKGWNPSYGPVVPHDTFPADCALCHESGSWNKIRDDFNFDHEVRTGVALNGAHAKAACLLCHNDRGLVQTFAARGCSGCHEDIHRARLGGRCTDCHTESTWRPIEAIRNHNRTRFPLVGAHAAAACFRCHPAASVGQYDGLSTECESCHTSDLAHATSPNHTALGLTSACQRCHIPTGWKPASFIHPASFPLSGGHAGQSCNACHTTPGVYTGLSTDCTSCHLPDFQRTTNPNHAAANFSTNCTQCHATTSWRGARFTHTATFPLTNSHAGRACTLCHTTPGTYAGLSADCASCHITRFQQTTNPNHASAGFSTACAQCHNTIRWQGAAFNHPATFLLTNGHAGRTCASCHTTPGVYTGLTTDCVSCHLTNYQRTTTPNHAAAGLPTTCANCHNTTQWQGANFQHTAAFPLTNGHSGVSCSRCHTTPGTYSGLHGGDCASCHLADYQRTVNPNHTTAGFPTTCTQCHNTTRWQGASFNHPASFPLANAHAGRTCSTCHTTPGTFTGLSPDCASCHIVDYQRTTNPNHSAARISTTCTQCHNTTRWQGAVFNHPASFPLTNSHAGRTCNQCHTTPGTYAGLSTACSSCHLADYQRTTNPNHTTAGYSTTCTQCHTTISWLGAIFNHPASFPLTNGHAGRACNQCHTTPGTYTGLNTACVSCHLSNYQGTTNPNHASAGFSTTCTQCHTTTTWLGAVFNHTWFPITSGAHRGVACTQCHLDSSNQRVFTCTNCHEHAQATMASHHSGVRNYVWTSTACYQCHPQGRH